MIKSLLTSLVLSPLKEYQRTYVWLSLNSFIFNSSRGSCMSNINRFSVSRNKVLTIIALIAVSVNSCSQEKEKNKKIPKTKSEMGMIISENTAMRIDPLVFSARIYQLKKGEAIEIIDKSKNKTWVGKTSNFWYKVKQERGIAGWVYGDNIRIFSKDENDNIDNYVSEFWEAETVKLRLELAGKWWSINKLDDFTNHGLEINEDGTYKSYQKGGKPIIGEYNFNFNDNEIIFLNGTSFKSNLNYIMRGPTYFLEYKTEKIEMRFKKLPATDNTK
jgi:hypothetical protein